MSVRSWVRVAPGRLSFSKDIDQIDEVDLSGVHHIQEYH
jgi:hypothetical protein